jgi:hypothetical protein
MELRALKALSALDSLLFLLAGSFAFMLFAAGVGGLGGLNAVGLTYAVAVGLLPLVSITCVVLAWRKFRAGKVRRALWLAAAPLIATACCAIALIGFHLAASLT